VSNTAAKLGPVWLAPGITRGNAVTKLYASFITVAMLTGMNFLQGYVLTEHLNIPRGEQGTLSGDLSLWTEVVAILLYNPMGVLADRIGRRPVYVFGILMVGLGYGLYPFAATADELLVYRLIFAVGLAATTGVIAILANDYPQNRSRGKLIGFSAMCNVAGTIFMASVIARIPLFMSAQGFDPVAGGKVMYLCAALLCVVSAVVFRYGLAAGTPLDAGPRLPVKVLVKSGFKAASNPRISLSYAAAFVARSDMVIKSMFLVLWAIQSGREMGLRPDEAMARFGVMYIAMYTVSFLSAPLFGWFIDKANRVTVMLVALGIAVAGYGSAVLISSPLEMSAMPYLMLMTLGSGCMVKASLALVGQEAPASQRGSVIAFNSFCGAIGILIFSAVGGRLFDSIGPWSPFLMLAIYQALLFIIAVVLRVNAPGPDGGYRPPA